MNWNWLRFPIGVLSFDLLVLLFARAHVAKLLARRAWRVAGHPPRTEPRAEPGLTAVTEPETRIVALLRGRCWRFGADVVRFRRLATYAALIRAQRSYRTRGRA